MSYVEHQRMVSLIEAPYKTFLNIHLHTSKILQPGVKLMSNCKFRRIQNMFVWQIYPDEYNSHIKHIFKYLLYSRCCECVLKETQFGQYFNPYSNFTYGTE